MTTCLVIPFRYINIFFFNDTATTYIYTLSLHDALPIFYVFDGLMGRTVLAQPYRIVREHEEDRKSTTSELQSRRDLVCRLLLEKKKAITDPSLEIAIEMKSRCRMLATTAPGMTPAFAMPITTSGSYSRNTLRARTRHSSPKNAQSTWRTLREGPLAGRGRGGGRGVEDGRGGSAMVGDSTLPA